MPKFQITVSGAELEVITRAIGRMPTAKEIKPRSATRSMGKPPTLNDRQRSLVTSRWADAVTTAQREPGLHPFVGYAHLRVIADATGRQGDAYAVLKAWGLK